MKNRDCLEVYLNLKLQRRARRHATINVVDFSDVTRCQNMVDVRCQWQRVRTYVTCLKHVLAYDNVSEQARKGFLCLWCDGVTDGMTDIFQWEHFWDAGTKHQTTLIYYLSPSFVNLRSGVLRLTLNRRTPERRFTNNGEWGIMGLWVTGSTSARELDYEILAMRRFRFLSGMSSLYVENASALV